MPPKVSVVIPVYNGEAYLRQCLDSVCAQTLEEIEIICVDDGSTDASWQILEEYREKNPRFRLFQQENQHVAAARNNGLTRAEGKYVIFWDCDDFFEPNALELLYRRAEETEAEICVCGSDLYNQEDGRIFPDAAPLNPARVPEGDTFNRFTNPDHILGFTNPTAWNKLFLLSFLTKNELSFPSFRSGEDRALVYTALCLASRITTVNEVLIHYRWNNPESIMGKISQEPMELIRAYELTVNQLIQRDIVPEESLRRKALQDMIYVLRWTRTEEDFLSVLQYVREGDSSLLRKCGIEEKELGYYYGANGDEYARTLLHNEPGDVLAFFMHDVYMKQRISYADQRRLRKELKTTKESRKAINEQLKEKKEELKTVKEERKALKEERKALKEELKTTKEERKTLKEERKALKEELKTTKEERKALKEERKALKAELKATKEERKALKEERKALKAELKVTKTELKATQRTLDDLLNSRSYRLGRALLFIPRKIRDSFRRAA